MRYIVIGIIGVLLWGCKAEEPAKLAPQNHDVQDSAEPAPESAPDDSAAEPARESAPDDSAAEPAPESTPDDSAAEPAPESARESAPDDSAAENVPDQEEDRGYALSPRDRQLLVSLRSDEEPEKLNAVKEENENLHFLWSDELHPELFYESVKDLGGVYIGIGTDQAYLFAGWQKPALAFGVDYDPWVVYIHMAYRAFFEICEDAQCLIELFHDREKGQAHLQAYYAEHAQKDEILEAYKWGRKGIARRLRYLRDQMSGLGIPSFISSPEMYAQVRALVNGGRFITMQANLLGTVAFQEIGRVLKAMDLEVSALYLSNAEQYWRYGTAFRQNMLGLPFSDKGIIVRTAAIKPLNNDYRYSVQKAEVFLAWMQSSQAKSVRHITRAVRPTEEEAFPFVLDNRMPKPEPEEAP